MVADPTPETITLDTAARLRGSGLLRCVDSPAAGTEDTPDIVRNLAAAAVERLVALRAVPPCKAELLTRLDDALANARAVFGEGRAATRFAPLIERAWLSDTEAELLAIAVTAEQDETFQRLLVSLTGDRDRDRLELWMLPLALPGAGAALVGPQSALRRAALVVVAERGAFGRAAVRVEPRVLWALHGDRAPDPALPADTESLTVREPTADSGIEAVLISGTDRTRRRQRALQSLAVTRCLTMRDIDSDAAWAAIVREATLAGAAILVEIEEHVGPAGRRWIEQADHLRWALSSERPIDLDRLPRRQWREFAAAEHDPDEAEWEHALGPDTPHTRRLTAEQLDRMRRAMAAYDGDFDAAYRRLVSPKLDLLARHVRPHAQWDDLILSAERKSSLLDLVNRYHMAARVYDDWKFAASPSRGLVALFSGPSGTGKSLAAEVVAGQLGLDLYKLNLSAVVSKYIGETEKNLDELFDAAGMGNFVLFFDEADALFAKRGDVGDAHDRYANLETSYLLQRLERYDGIVILATNYEKNIDHAFMRRIHVRIDFPIPTELERRALWDQHLRSEAPMDPDVDLDWLATQFELSGGAIRNAVIDAAFLAAAEGGAIGMPHLVRGVARELHKLGRLVTSNTFAPWFEALAAETPSQLPIVVTDAGDD
jgi:AAA+ superfamily predicted ATPase